MSRLVLLLASLAAATADAQGPPRVTLAIVNADCEDAPLASPVNERHELESFEVQ